MDKQIAEAIDMTYVELTNEIGKYFEMLNEHEVLDRIDKREQMIMKSLPLVFKRRLIKKLSNT